MPARIAPVFAGAEFGERLVKPPEIGKRLAVAAGIYPFLPPDDQPAIKLTTLNPGACVAGCRPTRRQP
jgi:hypothetical protein